MYMWSLQEEQWTPSTVPEVTVLFASEVQVESPELVVAGLFEEKDQPKQDQYVDVYILC